jgi:hypothetical protein
MGHLVFVPLHAGAALFALPDPPAQPVGAVAG